MYACTFTINFEQKSFMLCLKIMYVVSIYLITYGFTLCVFQAINFVYEKKINMYVLVTFLLSRKYLRFNVLF